MTLPPSLRPRLDALLDDHDPFAVDDEPTDAAAGVCRVYFFTAAARDAARRAIARALGADGARAVPVDVADEGWAERAQAALRAVRVDAIVVAPPWDQARPDAAGVHLVVIEPSLGFGTGHHASTRLCLRALQRLDPPVAACRRVLDLGTGSGVLAIAAARLGARAIVAVDRDADALSNARDNLAHNGVGDRVTLIQMDLGKRPGPTPPVAPADLVAANLTGAVFTDRRDVVVGPLAPGGRLIASGFTAGEEPAVRAALEPPLVGIGRYTEDEWVALVFRRPDDAARSPGHG